MRSHLAGLVIGLGVLVACGSSTSPYGGGGGGGGGGCTPTATKACTVAGNQFSPVTLTVSVGATVTWQNGDGGAHTVTNATGSADTYDLNLPAGGTASHLFNTAGTYNYYCKNHGINGAPPTGMHGTITVQ
ncbi:MAG: hypothetical protein AUI99_04550 [Gemmatimonadetes bacterium 13_1_40CM_3_69_22]|nr:MAG: hypothetical protein AUI99_04550 [Gemmatimonadetes bacterium 13_1_40CM_3_69_22]OLD97348.1 MAG: hypothetical protein AUG79_00255 [Gemmatimonadetes bacterium 13_1_20CM_4_69_16]PYO13837.1 MAG: hypothetical protein DMD31_11855 [Gemmatimonadota bacterium]